MKNTKIAASLKAGFSLVEMLVVIAIIGIIAAIAIPNIGSINDSAKQATAQRNAQSVASVLNAAIAAGVDPAAPGGDAEAITDGTTAVAAAVAGVAPTSGPFKSKTFQVPAMAAADQTAAAVYLSYDSNNKSVIYKANALSVEGAGEEE